MTAFERFSKYVTFHTTSDEDSETVPSTARQKLLGEYLAKELSDIGLENAEMDEKGYVYGFLPATKEYEKSPAIALIAHMDTSDAASGENVKIKLTTYTGKPIKLSRGIEIDPAENDYLNEYFGEEIITTDGTTLLGSDDKAGIAEIVTAVEYFVLNKNVPHGKIAVCFTPDEEIGRGADYVDIKKLGCDYGYTVDGGRMGEINFENFNAASVDVTFKGVNIHPGAAKDKMKNSLLIANEFVNMLPKAETPAHTCGREGFYHVRYICGDENKTCLAMLIRDHDKKKFESRKKYVKSVCDFINGKYGKDTADLKLCDSYYNMGEKVEPMMKIIDNVKTAMQNCGVEPIISPIRGGTDGARLSFDGLVCPNLCTGGENMHSIREYIPKSALQKCTDIIIELLKISCKK